MEGSSPLSPPACQGSYRNKASQAEKKLCAFPIDMYIASVREGLNGEKKE